MKYFGAHGMLAGHTPGLLIVEAPNISIANYELMQAAIRHHEFTCLRQALQEIKGKWAEVFRDTLDHIRNREKEYYTNLGNGVYYVEI